MFSRRRIAWSANKLINRNVVLKDTPRNQLFFAIRYGTFAKFRNFIRAKRAYNAKALDAAAYPYALRIEPVTACNLTCPLCPMGTGQVVRQHSLMSEGTYAKVLRDLGAHAFYVKMYVWGDPLVNKKLWRLIAMSEGAGIGTEISTNFSFKLSTEDIDRLIEAGLSWLIVSLDSATAENYEQYRRGGDFDLVLANMRRIIERKRVLGSHTPFVEWQFVPFRHNEHEIPLAKQMAKDIGVDGFRLKATRVDLDKTATDTGLGEADRALAQEWLPRDTRLHAAIAAGEDSIHTYHCPSLWGHATIHPGGAIAPCCETHLPEHDLGNISEQPFGQAWNGPVFQKHRRVALFGASDASDEDIPCHSCNIFVKDG